MKPQEHTPREMMDSTARENVHAVSSREESQGVTCHDGAIPQEKFPSSAVFVIGAGHFGARAVGLLSSQDQTRPIYAVDKDEERLQCLDHAVDVNRIRCDGVEFLTIWFTYLNPENIIIPAVPIHLAFEWLKSFLAPRYRITMEDPPKGIKTLLPGFRPGGEGSLLVSYADFICPDDCPEPEYCTVTGEKRDLPLFKLLEGLDPPGYDVYVIRSRQLAPGLGGYDAGTLMGAAETISRRAGERWLLCTSCKCHGILTALSINGGG